MRHLYTRSPDIPGPPRSLHRSPLQDLFTRPLRDLYTRSPDIPGPLRSPHYKIASKDLDQDPTRRKYRESCAGEIKIGTALQRERSDARKLRRGLHEPKQKMPQAERQRRSISKMSTALQPKRSDTHKVRRGLRLQTWNRHRATASAPCRQPPNTKCDFSMFCGTSTAPATKKWVRGIRSPVTATRNDVNIADPNSTTVPRNEHFELSKTDFKSTKYCACHEKCTFFTISNFEQPLRRFCTPLKTLAFCTLPDFRKSARRAGENAPPSRTSSRPRFAQAKCIFSISTTTYHREGRQICRTRMRTPPIYTRCFSLTVRTPKCGHTVWRISSKAIRNIICNTLIQLSTVFGTLTCHFSPLRTERNWSWVSASVSDPWGGSEAWRKKTSSCWRLIAPCASIICFGFVLWLKQNKKNTERRSFLAVLKTNAFLVPSQSHLKSLGGVTESAKMFPTGSHPLRLAQVLFPKPLSTSAENKSGICHLCKPEGPSNFPKIGIYFYTTVSTLTNGPKVPTFHRQFLWDQLPLSNWDDFQARILDDFGHGWMHGWMEG